MKMKKNNGNVCRYFQFRYEISLRLPFQLAFEGNSHNISQDVCINVDIKITNGLNGGVLLCKI